MSLEPAPCAAMECALVTVSHGRLCVYVLMCVCMCVSVCACVGVGVGVGV